ncbi:MAG: Xaa-Pro peptidase family protein [Candidatus Peribacteraceae bacterium]|nr:Xaa-Pro peptidase family protein [Candidatus Peribacteraceae bacterium]
MRPTTPSQVLKGQKIPALLITDRVNIFYVTGAKMSRGALLITARAITLFVDGRYIEEAKRSARKGITVQSDDGLGVALKQVRRCGIEAEKVTVAQLGRIKRKYKNTKFIQTAGIIEEFRRSKAPEELRAFRRAQRITHEMLRRIPAALTPGVTEKEIAWMLTTWAHELGADELAFEPIVAFGTHTDSPHHSPTDRKLKKRDIVQIDTGAKYGGYCADQSRVFFVGKPTALQQEVYDIVKQAKDAATHAVQAGVTNHRLDRIARAALREANYEQYFFHSLGHGVGLEIHEGVSLSQKAKKMKLLANEIITIEPGVYIPGKFGIRLEDEVVVPSGLLP